MATAPDRVAVLLVEDDEDDFQITQDLLASQSRTCFDLDWVPSYGAALKTNRVYVIAVDAAGNRGRGRSLVLRVRR